MDCPQVLGTGTLLKNTFCLSRDRYAFVSHHIGDLDNAETLQAYESAIEQYKALFRIKPSLLACDLHPDYLATRYASQHAETEKLPLVPVQHHHAHIAACMAENGWDSDEPVIGLSFDGTGYGSDGHIWGGEVLLASYQGFERKFHLAYVPLPGGDLAIKKPARMALSTLLAHKIDLVSSLPPVNYLSEVERNAVTAQIQKGINAPLTSSMGRLFDTISSLIGIRQEINYEGQAAIELEAILDPSETSLYPFEIIEDQIRTEALIKAVVRDLLDKVSPAKISARFHRSVVQMSLEVCQKVRDENGVKQVAISGGVWQNLYCAVNTVKALQKDHFEVLVHHHLPPNDGCVSLGQVMVAAKTVG